MRKSLLLLISLIAILSIVGCGSSTATKAIEKGKLALADNDIKTAESSFNLALTEDKNNKEAKEWINLIEQYKQFALQVENKEVENATKSLKKLKENNKFSGIKVLTEAQEKALDDFKLKIKKIDNLILELEKLYNPNDENSMPDESYLAKSDELLANPNITQEQKEKVIKFKSDATERANNLLAKEEEKRRIAEQAAANTGPNIDRNRAEEILVEKMDVDRSIAGVRTDPEMDMVVNGVTYYFFDVYALTEGFAASAYFVSSEDGTVKLDSEMY